MSQMDNIDFAISREPDGSLTLTPTAARAAKFPILAIYGSEEWVVSKDSIVITKALFKLSWKTVLRDCYICIQRTPDTQGAGWWWDLLIRHPDDGRYTTLARTTDTPQPLREFGQLLADCTGWKLRDDSASTSKP